VITSLGPSSPGSIYRYRREIVESSVGDLARLAVGWTDAEIAAPDGLGPLKTWWCIIGQQRRAGGGPFLLSEVVAAIVAGRLPDPVIMKTVVAIHREFESGKLAIPTLKLVRHDAGGLQMADANKRAAAILLSAVPITVPAVVVDLPPGCRLSAC
jgi:hypothetical protein